MEWLKDTWVTAVGYVVLSIVFVLTMRSDTKILSVKLGELTVRTSDLEGALARITEIMVAQARHDERQTATAQRMAQLEKQIEEVWREIVELRKRP